MVDIKKLGLWVASGILVAGVVKSFRDNKPIVESVKKVAKEAVKLPEKALDVVTGAAKETIKTTEKAAKSAEKEAKKVVKKVAKKVVKKKTVKKAVTKKVPSTEAPSELGLHKGHETKEGLAKDQKLVSKEPHEEAYQKSKDEK